VVDADVFGDVLPASAAARASAFAVALRRASASCVAAAPSHAALVAAEGCLLHRAHGALLRCCAQATQLASDELSAGCSVSLAPHFNADLSLALAQLAELPARTLPLGKLLCLRDAAAALLRANSDAVAARGAAEPPADAEPQGADLLLPLLVQLLRTGGCCDVLPHLEYAERFILLHGAPAAGGEDPRKGELGYVLTAFSAAAEHVRAAGRAAGRRSSAAPKGPVSPTGGAGRPVRATHTRSASSPCLLELVNLHEADAEASDEDAPTAAARPQAQWLSHAFARWRTGAPPPARTQTQYA
jgi:hypothetical protein